MSSTDDDGSCLAAAAVGQGPAAELAELAAAAAAIDDISDKPRAAAVAESIGPIIGSGSGAALACWSMAMPRWTGLDA